MKKLYFLAMFLFASTVSYGQIQQGKVMLGGSFNFKSGKTPIKQTFSFTNSSGYESYELNTQAKSNSFSFSPKLAYFINENLSLGLSTGLSINTNEIRFSADSFLGGTKFKTKTLSISFGPNARYYKMFNERFGMYGQAHLLYTKNRTKIEREEKRENRDNTSLESTSEDYNLGFSPGLVYFLSEKFALEASFGQLGYQWTNEVGAGDEPVTEEFIFDVSTSSLRFGFKFFL